MPPRIVELRQEDTEMTVKEWYWEMGPGHNLDISKGDQSDIEEFLNRKDENGRKRIKTLIGLENDVDANFIAYDLGVIRKAFEYKFSDFLMPKMVSVASSVPVAFVCRQSYDAFKGFYTMAFATDAAPAST
ncbi:hypothetical protein G7Y89_g8140 [Cudoniella acicularis]|uniref:Uncharacterized protein n=1 Tax=Cudoniella acicularis TaxID=354080 RepID=A0A8H4RIP4_9HELO|nr:hypothetical protein G7Y89_g8140 [Cudoniella acicularis]